MSLLLPVFSFLKFLKYPNPGAKVLSTTSDGSLTLIDVVSVVRELETLHGSDIQNKTGDQPYLDLSALISGTERAFSITVNGKIVGSDNQPGNLKRYNIEYGADNDVIEIAVVGRPGTPTIPYPINFDNYSGISAGTFFIKLTAPNGNFITWDVVSEGQLLKTIDIDSVGDLLVAEITNSTSGHFDYYDGTTLISPIIDGGSLSTVNPSGFSILAQA